MQGILPFQSKAKLLLEIPEDQIKIPYDIFDGIDRDSNEQIEARKQDYIRFRQIDLENKAEFKIFEDHSDGDGTTIEKSEKLQRKKGNETKDNARHASNTAAWADPKEIFYRRVIALGHNLTQGRPQITNTQRSGFGAQNIISLENGEKRNEVLSGMLEEYGIYEPFNENGELKEDARLVMNSIGFQGFAGGLNTRYVDVTGRNLQYPVITEQMDNFIESFAFLDKLTVKDESGKEFKGIINSILEATPNATVKEFKGIPKVFTDPRGSFKSYRDVALTLFMIEWSLKDYMQRAEKGEVKDFHQEHQNFIKRLTFHGIDNIPKGILKPENLKSGEDFVKYMRTASSILRKGDMDCFTLHLPEKEKYQVLSVIAKFARSSEMKEWAKEKYNTDENPNQYTDQDLFTIKGMDFSKIPENDIANLTDKKVQDMIDNGELKAPKDNFKRPILVIDNHQGYIEITADIKKNHWLNKDQIRKHKLVSGGGDSFDTDKHLLKAALCPDEDGNPRGIAHIVGKKINIDKLLDELMEDNGFDKKENSIEIRKKLKDRIFTHPNVKAHLAFKAAIFQELFEGIKEFRKPSQEMLNEFYDNRTTKPVFTTRIIPTDGNFSEEELLNPLRVEDLTSKELITKLRAENKSSIPPLSHIEPGFSEDELNQIYDNVMNDNSIHYAWQLLDDTLPQPIFTETELNEMLEQDLDDETWEKIDRHFEIMEVRRNHGHEDMVENIGLELGMKSPVVYM